MPARSAQYLVDRARFYVGEYDNGKLRDGFSTDDGEADRDILTAVNECVNELLSTGYFKCRFSLPLTSGTAEYTLDQDMGQILVVLYQGVMIDKTRLTTLYRQKKTATTTGTPTNWYNDIPDVIGLYPVPNTTDDTDDPSLVLIAESIADDLTDPADSPTRLPSVFHDRLPIGAALRVLLSFGYTDEANMAKVTAYTASWAQTVADVKQMAQNRQQDETYQVAPDEYRAFYNVQGGGMV